METTAGGIAFSMTEDERDRQFSPEQLRKIAATLPIHSTQPVDGRSSLPGVVALVTGWGSPFIDATTLSALPDLRAVFHAAGTVKPILDPAVWHRGITVTSAVAANAVPVAEYAFASIVFAGKQVFEVAADYRTTGSVDLDSPHLAAIGNHGRTVGIVGASAIGRRVVSMLGQLDAEVLLADPFVAPGDPVLDHATLTSLDDLMTRSSIVSLHAPLLPSTAGMLSARRLALLADGATVINTARAGLVDQQALVRELLVGRLSAVLDVTDPEPLPRDHPLRGLRNVFLTPHLAGARGNELRRLGASVVAEVEAFVTGSPPLRPIHLDALERTA